MNSEAWMAVLAVALIAHSVLQVQAAHEHRHQARRVDRVLDLLEVWAETWGDSPAEIRARLLTVLRRSDRS